MKTKEAVALFFTIVSSASIIAQDKAAPGATFSSQTNYVQVPVIVQKSGQHVSGLKKEDFVLKQDGKEQPIVNFEEVHTASSPMLKAAAPAGEAPTQNAQTPPQVTIIAIDMVDTPTLQRAYFFEQFRRYLNKTDKLPGIIGLVEIERGGIHFKREFTRDPKVLLSALSESGTSQPTINDDASLMGHQISDEAITAAALYGTDPTNELILREADERMTRFQDRSSRLDTLYAIQQLAQALKGIPGRKSLLLVGAGFKFIDQNTVMRVIGGGHGGVELQTTPDASMGQTLDQTIYTWKLLNDANVAVYPIDTRGTANSVFESMDTANGERPSDLTYKQNQIADRDTITSFKVMAASTGGKACFYRTDLDNCLREAIDDDRDYYLLGFYVDKKSDLPGWHKIEVKIAEKATVRYREGFMLAKFNGESSRKTDVGLALSSPFPYTELRFGVKFEPITGPKGKAEKFNLALPPAGITAGENGHIDFDVVAVARSTGGKEAARFAQRVNRNFPAENIADIQKNGINYSNRLDLPPGDYGVWFVVRDNISGRTGSAVMPLKVQ
jgi:VWFA-related protein